MLQKLKEILWGPPAPTVTEETQQEQAGTELENGLWLIGGKLHFEGEVTRSAMRERNYHRVKRLIEAYNSSDDDEYKARLEAEIRRRVRDGE